MFGVVDRGLVATGELEPTDVVGAIGAAEFVTWLIDVLKLDDVLIDLICCC
jgi:hypothetical protein